MLLLSIKMAFSGQLLQHSLWSNPEFTSTLSVPPLLKANNEPVKKQSQRKLRIRGIIKNKYNSLVTFSKLNPEKGTSMNTFSPSDTIKKFYSSINNKDMSQLALLIAEDCFFDDFSYTQPFRGRKEALKFLGQLTTCMGKNTEFCIEHIYEGVALTTVVNWHLEWNKKQVPFTRGCSCYELSRNGEELIIRKAQVIVESPIKPGSLALLWYEYYQTSISEKRILDKLIDQQDVHSFFLILEAFQKVISACDTFPEAADWLFLMSPQLIGSFSRYTTWLRYMSTLKPWTEDQESNSKESEADQESNSKE